MEKKRNYGRFYSAVRKIRHQGDPEEFRRQLVLEYSGGRTESLREMDWKGYVRLCEALEGMTGGRDLLRRSRSAVLRLMQQLGVDTTDWGKVNGFCSQARIAGKPFAELSVGELDALSKRLRAMKRKGWSRRADTDRPTYLINIAGASGINYN